VIRFRQDGCKSLTKAHKTCRRYRRSPKVCANGKVQLNELRILTNLQGKEQGEKEEGQKPTSRIKNDEQITGKEICTKYQLSTRYDKKFMLNHRHVHSHSHKSR